MDVVNANRTRDTIIFLLGSDVVSEAGSSASNCIRVAARGCALHPRTFPLHADQKVRIAAWWSQFLKAWRKIGNAYQHRTPPPPQFSGCETFVVPDHAPLVPRSDHDHEQRLDTIDRSCGRKARYSTEDFANAVGIQCWQERNIWLRPYSCAFCGGWHLTRSNAPPRMKPGWRLPKISERQQNTMRNARQRPNRRRYP